MKFFELKLCVLSMVMVSVLLSVSVVVVFVVGVRFSGYVFFDIVVFRFMLVSVLRFDFVWFVIVISFVLICFMSGRIVMSFFDLLE